MITLLSGENEFAIFAEARRITDEFLAQNDPFGLERLDGELFEASVFEASLMQLPFLVSKKLVIIKHPFASKPAILYLADAVGRISEQIDVALIEPKPDKRTTLYKTLVSQKAVKLFENLSRPQLIEWAKQYIGSHNATMSSQATEHLIDRVGSDQMLLAREIEKLAPLGEVSMQDIDELTEEALTGTVFEMLDHVFNGNKTKAIKLYDQLISAKTDPIQILGLIAWQLHIFALVKVNHAKQGTNIPGVHPFVVSKAEKALRTVSLEQLTSNIKVCLDRELAIKSSSIDPADAVRVLLLEL